MRSTARNLEPVTLGHIRSRSSTNAFGLFQSLSHQRGTGLSKSSKPETSPSLIVWTILLLQMGGA
jgi:hypothetical protein